MPASSAPINLRRIARSGVVVPITGTAPLISNKFSEKARNQMLERQMGHTAERPPKDPEACYRDSMYVLPPGPDGEERYGFPAPGFKSAVTNGARFFRGSKVTMEMLKTAIFVVGEGPLMLVQLNAKPQMVEHNVRNETGVADIRFRASFWPWSAELTIVWVTNLLSQDAIVNLVDAGGFNGVGEWRPSSKSSKTGTYGTWNVPLDANIRHFDV